MAKRTIKARELLKIVEKQGYRCALSGRELEPENVSADHIEPLARGGSHTVDNIQLVDHQVNRAKGTMKVSEFIQLCKDVTEYQRIKGT